jgi:multidrug efflux pump subunit AcrA (membrane-fusion protein)
LGVLLVSGSRSAVHDPANVRFLTTVAKCLSATLELTSRAEGGFVRRLATQFRRAVSRRAFALLTLCAIGVVALMASPWPYRISCRCVVEPMQRRFVVAPHDGLIEISLVQPGDIVRAGQPLARMDAREVRWELAGLEADRRQALQQRDTSLTRGELAKSELARLEVEQLDAKLELLRRRASLLELQAPLDGIVLSGSLDKLSSAPVKTGQVLFEIAPLDRLRVEVSTPAEDYRHVVEGTSVEMRFEGRLNELQTGTLSRVRPRSEVREAADVFVAEVEMDNPDHSLRPGQRGSAVVIGSSHPLAWNLFHKAADRVRQWLPF